jgi:hypothetical protein
MHAVLPGLLALLEDRLAEENPDVMPEDGTLSFRGASKTRTRNLEIPGSMLRIAPE